ncbi:MAG TPA: hypothetical protein VME18_10600 [Acidobacteriaceae bacterium]|nr:hypothetical protein [Acidobacteriaceae bacterium]
MRESLSIWFFSGILLLAYGLLIAGTGIWEFFGHPPAPAPVLYQLHPDIWWGGLMTALGLFYTVKFRPR